VLSRTSTMGRRLGNCTKSLGVEGVQTELDNDRTERRAPPGVGFTSLHVSGQPEQAGEAVGDAVAGPVDAGIHNVRSLTRDHRNQSLPQTRSQCRDVHVARRVGRIIEQPSVTRPRPIRHEDAGGPGWARHVPARSTWLSRPDGLRCASAGGVLTSGGEGSALGVTWAELGGAGGEGAASPVWQPLDSNETSTSVAEGLSLRPTISESTAVQLVDLRRPMAAKKKSSADGDARDGNAEVAAVREPARTASAKADSLSTSSV
jgi:hypothetical protein